MPSGRPPTKIGENKKSRQIKSLTAFLISANLSCGRMESLSCRLFVSINRICDRMANASLSTTTPTLMWYGFFFIEVVSGTTKQTWRLNPLRISTGLRKASLVPSCSKPTLIPREHRRISLW